MSIPVTGNVRVTTSLSEALVSELATGTTSATLVFQKTFANGTGADAINSGWTDTRTLAISTPVTLTLSALTDGLGRTRAMTKIRLLMIKNNGTGTLTVGAATAAVLLFSDVTDKIPIPPGGVFLIVAPGATGIPVTATTADGLKLDPGATACPVEIVIEGEE